MAQTRTGALIKDSTFAIPIVENFRRAKHATYSVGTSVVALPTTNMSYRRGLFVQNNHASNGLYVGSCDPEFILGKYPDKFNSVKMSGLAEPITSIYTFHRPIWVQSTGAAHEWFASGDPTGLTTAGLTEPTQLYYSLVGGQGAEVDAGAKETVGSLSANHKWGFGANAADPCSGVYTTLYVHNTVGSPATQYDYWMLYVLALTADTTTTTGGLQVDAGSTMWLTLDGTCRLFGIASGASTPVAVMEVA
jgi:hypothetical protein